jgi:hypothetical protein
VHKLRTRRRFRPLGYLFGLFSDLQLFRCMAPNSRVRAQPQRDVLRLHRRPHHSHQIVAQGISRSVSSLSLAEKASNWRYTTGDAHVALLSTSTLHSTIDEELGEQQARGVAEHHRPEEDGVAALGDGAVQHSTGEGGDEHERRAQHCEIE